MHIINSPVESNNAYITYNNEVSRQISALLGTDDYTADIANMFLLNSVGKEHRLDSKNLKHEVHKVIESYFENLRMYSFSIAMKKTENRDLSEEIAQESILELLRSQKSKHCIKGWLYKVTLNIIARHYQQEARSRQLLSEVRREELMTKHLLEIEIPEMKQINYSDAGIYLTGADRRDYLKIKQYKNLRLYAEAAGMSYATARQISVRIRHNFKAAYLKAQGWTSTPAIIPYERYRAIRRFLGKIAEISNHNDPHRARNSNLSIFLSEHQDVFDGFHNIYDWGITPLNDNRYKVYLFDKSDGVSPILISIVILITRSDRIIVKQSKKHVLAASIPLKPGEVLQVDKGHARLTAEQISLVLSNR